MATPTLIPIKGDLSSHSGPLGIVKVFQPRSTELEALYPKRTGAHDLKRRTSIIWEPPTYLDNKSRLTAMVWCPDCAEWKRRDAYYKDCTRPNGLEWRCRQCSNPNAAARMRRYRARKKAMSVAA